MIGQLMVVGHRALQTDLQAVPDESSAQGPEAAALLQVQRPAGAVHARHG